MFKLKVEGISFYYIKVVNSKLVLLFMLKNSYSKFGTSKNNKQCWAFEPALQLLLMVLIHQYRWPDER